jgi:hypothetical protein
VLKHTSIADLVLVPTITLISSIYLKLGHFESLLLEVRLEQFNGLVPIEICPLSNFDVILCEVHQMHFNILHVFTQAEENRLVLGIECVVDLLEEELSFPKAAFEIVRDT